MTEKASLTYRTALPTVAVSVAETLAFAKAAARIWTDEELTELIEHVAHHPEAGVVIPGTGGVRKLRWGRIGTGKRGGARVIYFYYRDDRPLYLLLAYAKAQASDLSPEEKKAVAALAATLRDKQDKVIEP